ncbi:hypothetical protein AMATHDRAFT_72687 [Amanita thiersii Skay4041]|uniref:TLC domain-containing protein n=1 Tax=Amanita thiersii Skay4041 TaxID=703135 RepID=A0A2A9P0R6_9AGAR|nr:hypothetical protein AMATHDRAFT_72687 [Amanita thiersii Skay4041]
MPGTLDRFVGKTLGLVKLPPHLPALAISFFLFLLIHQVASPILSRRLAPQSYGAIKGKIARNNWAIHVVSQCHVLVVVPLALWCIMIETPGRNDDWDRAFGWDEHAGIVHAIACGYFLWDSLDAIINFIDLGFVLHGISTYLFTYHFPLKPFVAYYATRCLLWESSTFFLNNHWFLDKTGRTGTKAQLVNGIFLLATFFGVRIVYGGKISWDFMHTLLHVRKDVPPTYAIVFSIGNVLLVALNWIWFAKMIAALRKRFNKDAGERTKLVRGSGASVEGENNAEARA